MFLNKFEKKLKDWVSNYVFHELRPIERSIDEQSKRIHYLELRLTKQEKIINELMSQMSLKIVNVPASEAKTVIVPM